MKILMKNNKFIVLILPALLISLVVGGCVYGLGLKSMSVQTAHAASVDFLLELDGIKGESTDSRHPNTIEINSFSWGVSNSGGHGGGGGAGKVSFQDLHFTSKVSKASPMLMQALTTGQRIPSATLYVRKTGDNQQQEYYVVHLENVMVSSYQSSGGGTGGDVPVDEVTLNFTKIEFTYTPQNADGSLGTPLKASWDLAKGTKI